MRIPRLFVDAELVANQPLQLGQEASRYLGKALRLAAGDAVVVFNGRGGSWQAQLAFDGAVAVVTPQQFNDHEVESPLAVTLLQAIGRGERMDYAIQKAVELGVTAIQPIFSERTVVRLQGDRLAKRQAHWLGIARAACEQCGRNVVPTIKPALPLLDAIAQTPATLKLVLAPATEGDGLAVVDTAPPESVALLIGPEGGLAPQEIAEAVASGWQAWQLGPRVLRTETAGSVALAVLQSRWGDFG